MISFKNINASSFLAATTFGAQCRLSAYIFTTSDPPRSAVFLR